MKGEVSGAGNECFLRFTFYSLFAFLIIHEHSTEISLPAPFPLFALSILPFLICLVATDCQSHLLLRLQPRHCLLNCHKPASGHLPLGFHRIPHFCLVRSQLHCHHSVVSFYIHSKVPFLGSTKASCCLSHVLSRDPSACMS